MGLIVCVIGAFLAGAYLRKRGHGVFASIALGALVFPIVVAFTSLIYPADLEGQMWAMITIPVSYFWGIVTAGLGCALVLLIQRAKRDA
ncbi:MAG: hypothetical protein ABI268_09950 [Rhodanobacter sp.]